jgi:hypothetical protein
MNAACNFSSRGLTGIVDASGRGARGAISFQKWHATSWPSALVSGGVTSAQSSCAYGQRVRKRHPEGGSMGLGTSP